VTASRSRAFVLVGVAALALTLGRPMGVAAQGPTTTLPPVIGPIGADLCETAGLGSILGGAVLGQAGLDPSTLEPVNEAVGETCAAVPPPADTVACPVDAQVTNQIFAVPLPAGVPLPTPTPFGLTVEQMRAVATLLSASPDSVDPIGSLLGCTTIPGLPGTAPSGPAAAPPSPPTSEATLEPAAAAPGPSGAASRPAPVVASTPVTLTGTGQLASALPASASFPPIPGPLGTPAASAAFLALVMVLLGIGSYSWRRAGRNVSFR
jgi:hypothetical protein